MDTPPVNGSLTNRVSSPTGLARMSHIQYVLPILPKSHQEIMQAIQHVVGRQCILDFHHRRFALPEIGVVDQFFVMSRPADDSSQNGKLPLATTWASNSPWPSDAQSVSAPSQSELTPGKESRQMIQKAICHILQYKRFWHDTVMANSPLQTLLLVQQAYQTWKREQELLLGTLSEHDKARLLRNFLTKCLDEELCPSSTLPKKLSEATTEIKTEWSEYLILRWQYVDGESREAVIRKLEKREFWITSNMYKQFLKRGRERLSTIIWQKEMQARKASLG